MTVRRIEFLHWAKTHSPARYELTVSGVAHITPNELDFVGQVDLERRGAYGHPDLIDLIATTYGVAPENVLPTPGTSSANFIALAGALERGQRVLVESPTYEPLIRVPELLGLEVARFDRIKEEGFRPNVDQVQHELNRGARAVIMSDLHNPSGSRCPPDDLKRLSSLCARHSALLLVDEVYRDFACINCGARRESAASLGPHVLTTSSLTKVYGLGGLRAGWILGSPEQIERAQCVMDHLSVDLPAPTTSLSIHAFKRLDRLAERTRAIYQHAHPVLSQWLSSRADLTGYGDAGATFAYLRLPAGTDADAFCQFLREEHDTQIVPGSFFGASDHIRIGFGVPPEKIADLREGLSRVGHALDQFPART
ncbi:MAG: pyridoxal phosphate-dependent aminotransferase [Planctomycetes bacterium]|nr:pyridoxal phosphate-dependent aminotransferase [Planctomycetota bacterium]